MTRVKFHIVGLLLATGVPLFPARSAEIPWSLEALFHPPAVYPATGFEEEGVRAIFYEGLPWRGNPTRVFAWYGVPDGADGKKLPAMVLAHGGGGTAFAEWVRIWNERGYAAIAMDLEGTLPEGDFPNRPRHDWSGPSRQGDFSDIDWPVEDMWFHHAVADIILANSLLRSFPEVDPDRIGLTGISWGGILTSTVMGVDSRFQFAVPVYGCGFLDEAPVFRNAWEKMGPEKAALWKSLWDGASHLDRCRIPSLWVNGTNDLHFPLDVHSKSYRTAGGEKTLSVRVGMLHSHPHGWQPEEIYAFADSIARDGAPLPRIVDAGREGERVWAEYDSTVAVAQAEIVYATGATDLSSLMWRSIPAVHKSEDKRVDGDLPPDSAIYFLNLTDERGLVVSTPIERSSEP